MEVDQIAKKILSEKPKPRFSICLNLDINSTINEQFEIISLMFFRGINDLIVNQEYNDIKDVKELKKYLLKKILLLKIYFSSFGVNLKSENVLKKFRTNDESSPGIKTNTASRLKGLLSSPSPGILQDLDCKGKTVSLKAVKNKSNSLLSCCVIAAKRKYEESPLS